ncbi:hypothetical protein H5410_011833 [Solanum commersonii]|uniref:Uncharacterized protein n=1 Tax=Solanum commersonii TaxID=4109 RepID=A0A9J6AR75_SOLCO|nr:hypothetical protein H5410_011833 [Solanum commersonii]
MSYIIQIRMDSMSNNRLLLELRYPSRAGMTYSPRDKVLHICPTAFFILLALSPSSTFRLGFALGVIRLDRLVFFGPSKAVNFSPSTLFDKGREYHSINNKKK